MCEESEPGSKCQYCKNTGKIEIHRCPRKLITRDVSMLIPYFYDWRNSDGARFPDGRGRYFQPRKLTAIFGILNGMFDKLKVKT